MAQQYYEYVNYKEEHVQEQKKLPKGACQSYIIVFQSIFYIIFHVSPPATPASLIQRCVFQSSGRGLYVVIDLVHLISDEEPEEKRKGSVDPGGLLV